MKNLRAVPIDKTSHEKLLESVQEFCKREFGAPYDFSQGLKSWAIVDYDTYETVGTTLIRLAYDIPMFHVKAGKDREERKTVAEPARNQLVGRLVNYVQDNIGVGHGVFVHIDPEQERLWRAFLKVINAQPSNRVIVTS